MNYARPHSTVEGFDLKKKKERKKVCFHLLESNAGYSIVAISNLHTSPARQSPTVIGASDLKAQALPRGSHPCP